MNALLLRRRVVSSRERREFRDIDDDNAKPLLQSSADRNSPSVRDYRMQYRMLVLPSTTLSKSASVAAAKKCPETKGSFFAELRQQETPLLAPVTVERHGVRMYYVWSNGRLNAVAQRPDLRNAGKEGLLSEKRLSRLHSAVFDMFFPDPRTVIPSYWEWTVWRLFARFFATCLTIFGTQSLLVSVGLGAKQSFPAAVAVNWMVKDGLGRVARLIIATKFSRNFDANIKKSRFVSCVVSVICASGEFLTPYFPQYFLPLAAVSRVGMAVVITVFASIAPSLSMNFTKSHTMCNMTAKSQAQCGVVDSVAIALAASATHLCGSSPQALRALPGVAYFVCSFMGLFGMYKENKALVFNTLNMQRMKIVARHWARHYQALTPAKASQLETVWGTCLVDDKTEVAVEIGRLEQMVDCPTELNLLLRRHRQDLFMMGLNRAELRDKPYSRPTLLLAFKEGVKMDDVMQAFLVGAFAQKRLADLPSWNRRWVGCVLEDARHMAQAALRPFMEALEERGWWFAELPISITDLQQTQQPSPSVNGTGP